MCFGVRKYERVSELGSVLASVFQSEEVCWRMCFRVRKCIGECVSKLESVLASVFQS